jgi:ribonuclease HI
MDIQIFTDGGSRGNPGPAAIGVVVKSSDETVIFETGKTIGVGTNNEAEYQAFLLSLEWLKTQTGVLELSSVTWKLDSKLVVEQLNKKWKIKEPRMLTYAQDCWKDLALLSCPFKITHIPREQNSQADALVNQALDQSSEIV